LKYIAIFSATAFLAASAGVTADPSGTNSPASIEADAAKKDRKAPKRDEKLLKRLFKGRSAGKAQNCISNFSSSSLIPVGEDIVALRRGNTVYRNNLKFPCRGLDDDDILIVNIRSGNICKNDRLDRVDRFSGIQRSFCVLGEFIPYRKSEKSEKTGS